MNDQQCKLMNIELQENNLKNKIIKKGSIKMPDTNFKISNTSYKISNINNEISEQIHSIQNQNLKLNKTYNGITFKIPNETTYNIPNKMKFKVIKDTKYNNFDETFKVPQTNQVKLPEKTYNNSYQNFIMNQTYHLNNYNNSKFSCNSKTDNFINNSYLNKNNLVVDQISKLNNQQNLKIKNSEVYKINDYEKANNSINAFDNQNFNISNYNKKINFLNDELILKQDDVNKNDVILEKNISKNDLITQKNSNDLEKLLLKNNLKRICLKNDNQLKEKLDNKIDLSLINKTRSKKRILPNPTVKVYIDFPYSLTKDNKIFEKNLNENFDKFALENINKNFVMKNLSLNIQNLKTGNSNQLPVKYFFEYRPNLISTQNNNQSSKYTLENLAKKNNFFDDLSFSLNLDPLQLSSYQSSSKKIKDSDILENSFFNHKIMNSIKLNNSLYIKTIDKNLNEKLNLDFSKNFNKELINTNEFIQTGNNLILTKNDVFLKNNFNLIPNYEKIKLNFALNSRLVHIVKHNKLDQKIKNYSNYLYEEHCGIILCLGLSTLPNLKYFIGYYVANIVYNSVAQGILNVGDIVLAINSIQLNLNSKMSLEKASELLNQQFNTNRYLQLKIVPRNLIANQPLFNQKNYETIFSSDRIRTVIIDNKSTKPLGLTIKGGKKYGFGIIVSKTDKNSLSEQAGLKPGDLILTLNGHDFSNLDHNQAAFLLQTISLLILKVRYVGFEPLSALLFNFEDFNNSTFEMFNDNNLKLSYLSKYENMSKIENNSNILLNDNIEKEFLLNNYANKTMKDHYLKSIVDNYDQTNFSNNSFIVPHLPPCIKDFEDYSLPFFLVNQNNYYNDNLDQEIENELILEEKVNLFLNPTDRKIFLFYKNEFFSKKITLNSFVFSIYKLLDTNEKCKILKYLRPLIPINDLALFDQLIINLNYKNFDKEFNQNNSSKLYRSNSFDDRLMDQENWMNNFNHDQNHLPLIDSVSPKRPSRFLTDFKPMSPYQNNLNKTNNYQQPLISPFISSKSLYYPNPDMIVNQVPLESQNFLDSQNNKIFHENLNEELYNPSNMNKNYKTDQSYSQNEKHLINNSMNNFKRHRSLPADTFPKNLNNFTPIIPNLNQSHIKNASFKLPVKHYDEDCIRVKINKSKPILGIAIEGGINVENQVQPRIISIHEKGSAFDSGELKVGHIILEIDGVSTEGLTHSEVAKLLAYSYYTSSENFIELLVKMKHLNYS